MSSPDSTRAAGRLSAAIWLAGCCPPRPAPPPGPAGVLADYARALRDKRPAAALELVAGERRAGLTAEQLLAFVEAGGPALDRLLAGLEQTGRLKVAWQVELADGRRVTLVREPDGWRVAGGPLLPPTGSTPQEAIDELLAAIAAGDCQALVRLAPPEVRAEHPLASLEGGCARQLEVLKETAERIRQARGGLVRVAPDRAVLAYSRYRKLVLVRRGGRWYVQDL